MLKIVTEMRSGTGSGLSPFGQNAASTIRDSREREKKEMSDLNDRLASYIEKVVMRRVLRGTINYRSAFSKPKTASWLPI